MNTSEQLRRNKIRLLLSFLLLLSACLQTDARSFRPGMMPNGNKFSCQNCHLSSAGGGSRNPFGNAVFSIVRGGSSAPFWSPTLAALDSDGDGFTNGEELGDPDGDGIPSPGAEITNPGSASSKPAPSNSAPTIGSSPVGNASFGSPYNYQITAQDPEGHTLIFSKVDGPAWMTVSPAGLVAGVPPEDTAADVQVTVRVTDNGNPAMSAQQTYSVRVGASFAGWQNLRFESGSGNTNAGPDADPDQDGLPNLAEYLLKTDPNSADSQSLATLEFDSSGRLALQLRVRSDDPAVVLSAEFSDSVTFDMPSQVVLVETGSTGGFKTFTATDSVARSERTVRFGRNRVQL